MSLKLLHSTWRVGAYISEPHLPLDPLQPACGQEVQAPTRATDRRPLFLDPTHLVLTPASGATGRTHRRGDATVSWVESSSLDSRKPSRTQDRR